LATPAWQPAQVAEDHRAVERAVVGDLVLGGIGGGARGGGLCGSAGGAREHGASWRMRDAASGRVRFGRLQAVDVHAQQDQTMVITRADDLGEMLEENEIVVAHSQSGAGRGP
jgi:hypothetical protein